MPNRALDMGQVSFKTGEDKAGVEDEMLHDAMNCILRLEKSAGTRQVNNLLRILTNASFNHTLFQEHGKSVQSCKSFLSRVMQHTASTHGFEKIEMKMPCGEKSSVLYAKNAIHVLQKQVSMSHDQNFSFRPASEERAEISEPMHTQYFNSLYSQCRMNVMSSRSKDSFWVDSVADKNSSFVGFFQLYSDKTAMTLKSNAMVAYPVHLVLLNASPSFRRWLIDNGHTLLGFLPAEFHNDDIQVEDLEEESRKVGASNVIELNDYIRHTTEQSGRVLKLEMLHKCMGRILQPLLQSHLTGFRVENSTGSTWTCFPLFTSYCCDIPEAKDMSCVKHGTRGPRPCVRCMSSASDFETQRPCEVRDMSQTVMVRADLKRTGSQDATCLEMFESLNVSTVQSFLEGIYLSHRTFLPPDVYSIFTFESLHNLHLGISRLLKNCFTEYLHSNSVTTNPVGARRYQRTLSSQRIQVLKVCNAILAEVENTYPASGLHVDFSKTEKTSQLNGLFLREGVRGMLEGKNFRAVDMVFPFVLSFIDRILGFQGTADLTSVHTMYTEIMVTCLYDIPRRGISIDEVDIFWTIW